MSKHRLELFSDAIMAIIITVMVLDLRAPLQAGWHAWLTVLPSIAVYLLGFLTIAGIWSAHRQYFVRFRVINHQIMWANFTLLFLSSLLPLTVRAVADHPHDTADTVAFLIVLTSVFLCTGWMRLAAKKAHEHDAEFQEWSKARSRYGHLSLSAFVLDAAIAFVSPIAAQLLVGCFILASIYGITRSEREQDAPASATEAPDATELSLQ
ncbi:MAG TPA: TMEM175 family protein [Candidatus Aquilonibacter sp.]|nr:TMEM175 family protein [Candidatus Aquilonibacter sp.]